MMFRSFGMSPLLVCLHPIGLNSQLWEEFVPSLGESHKVVCLDLPGHGSAPPLNSKWTIAAMADFIEPVLKSLSSEYVLLGASLGGMVAQELALRARRELRMLILADTLSHVTAPQKKAMRARALTSREQGMSALLDETMLRWFTKSFLEESGPDLTKVRAMLAGCNPYVHAACWEAMCEFDVANELPGINVPVWTIVGSEDISTPPYLSQAIADRVPDGRCRLVTRAGHMSMIEKPAEFASIVTEATSGLVS